MSKVTTPTPTSTPKAPKVPEAPIKTENTADPKAAKKAERKANRKAAETVIRAAVRDGSAAKALSAAGMQALVEALVKRFSVAAFGTRMSGGGDSGTSKAVRLFADKAVGTSIDELTIFKEARIGRGEMKKAVRTALKTAQPNDRLWITFDYEKEVWTLIAKGPNPPAGWTGYTLTEKAEKAS